MSTALAPSFNSARACCSISPSLLAIGASSSAAASGRFGVTMRARGISTRIKASTASRVSSRSPEVATITGSSTMFCALWRSSPAATASMAPTRDNMPIFTAPTARSENTASICLAMKSGGTSWIPLTPCVFCAVNAVIDAGAVDAERGEGFQIRLNAGAPGGIRAGDGQCDRGHADTLARAVSIGASSAARASMM